MSRFCFLGVCGVLVLGFLGSGCQKRPKGLTQIPGSEGPILGSGKPSDMMDGGGGVGLPGPGGVLNGDGFPVGSDVGGSGGLDGSGQSVLPDRDLLVGLSEEDVEALGGYTVYFDFDRYSVRAEELVKVEAVADFLRGEEGVLVKVEGHCDERGTEEYNRALGERRALSVREVLIRLGVSPDRVTTESWGEDRPAVLGESEGAYAKNRRCEFVVLRR